MKHACITFAFLLLASCSTSSNLPITNNPDIELTSIKDKYVKQLAKIQVGDYIEKVATIFPEMFMTSDTMKNTQYEFDYHQQYFLAAQSKPLEKTYSQTLRFYFVNKKLVHWGVK